jgi:hypothetical protein
MLKFSNLTEASLTFAEITRDDRAFRADLFLKKYQTFEPFETTDGKQVVLKYNKEIEKAIFSKDSKLARSVGLETMDGEKISFGKLKKTEEFGGGRGSGGGSDNTRATESAQCVYLQAIWDNPNTKFTPDDIRNAFSRTHTDAKVDEVLLGDEAWISSSIDTAKSLHKVLKKKTYSFHRGSAWVNALEKKFKELNREEKAFQNVNKWTPADIWMVAKGAETKYDIQGAKSLQYLNNELLKAFAERDILGVSLKKVSGRLRLTQVNYKAPFKSPKFTKVSYGKRDFFKSKDGYIMYGGGEIQFRTFPTFQCEIIGKAAKHGKVSQGGIDAALYATTTSRLENRKQLEASIKKDREGFLDKFYNFYTGTTNKPVSREDFGKELSSKNIEWLVSKYYVTTLFTMVKGREQEFMTYLYRVAKSQSKLSAVHLKVQ